MFGSCLMASYTHRIACAAISVGPTGEVSLRPISVDDPLVRRDVTGLDDTTPDPNCGTCF